MAVDYRIAVKAEQPADIGVTADRAGGIGVDDLAAVVPCQPADIRIAADRTSGVGVAHRVGIEPYQPADTPHAADRAGGIGVAYYAGIDSYQPADTIGAATRAGGVGVTYRAFIEPYQPTDILTAADRAAEQAEVADRAAKYADQPRVVAGHGDRQVGNRVAQPGQRPVEPSYGRRPDQRAGIGRPAGVEVACQRVTTHPPAGLHVDRVAGRGHPVDAVEVRHRADQRIALAVDGQRLAGLAVREGQRAAHREAQAPGDGIGGAVAECHLPAARDGDRRVDRQVAERIEHQRVAAGQRHRGGDRQPAGGGLDAQSGGQVQRLVERETRDVGRQVKGCQRRQSRRFRPRGQQPRPLHRRGGIGGCRRDMPEAAAEDVLPCRGTRQAGERRTADRAGRGVVGGGVGEHARPARRQAAGRQHDVIITVRAGRDRRRPAAPDAGKHILGTSRARGQRGRAGVAIGDARHRLHPVGEEAGEIGIQPPGPARERRAQSARAARLQLRRGQPGAAASTGSPSAGLRVPIAVADRISTTATSDQTADHYTRIGA